MLQALSALLCLLFALVYSTSKAFAQPANTKPLETLIWTYTDFKQLRENAAEWHDKKGVDGFIFCYVNQKGPPRWDSGADSVQHIYAELPQTIAALKKAGIGANFVHAGMDDPTWTWFDEARVAKTIETFRALAVIAKNSGARGVAIDTEAYSGSKMWDPRGYSEAERPLLAAQIRKTAAAICAAILEGFPDAEILLLPEGAYIALENSWGGELVYEHWIDYYNGMASVKPAKRLTIMCEMSYHWTDPIQAANMVGKLRGFVQAKTEDALFWRQCDIAVGAGVLDDPKTKKAAFTPAEFAIQWDTFGKLSSKYRWIFASESGFAQIPESHHAPGTERVKGLYQPLAPNADEYFKVIRNSPLRLQKAKPAK